MITYNTTVKNSRLAAVVAALGATGMLVIGTSALSGAVGVLVTIPLANPAGTVSAGVLTMSGAPLSAAASATGTAALAELRDGSGAVVASGLTVGTAGTNIVLGTTSINTGNVVSITAAAITHG